MFLSTTATPLLSSFREGGLNHLPGQPVPMVDNLFREEILPDTQTKPPLIQTEAIASHLVTCYLGDEADTHHATTSFQDL